MCLKRKLFYFRQEIKNTIIKKEREDEYEIINTVTNRKHCKKEKFEIVIL